MLIVCIVCLNKPRSANYMFDLSSENETYYLHKLGTFAFFTTVYQKLYCDVQSMVNFNVFKIKVFELLLPKP